MPRPASTPILHVRLIGRRPLVDQLGQTIAASVRDHLDAGTTYTIHTRTARRTGHIRLYLTAIRKDSPDASRTAK